MSYNIERNTALLVVDPQNDFFRGGALPLRRAEETLPEIQTYINKFVARKAPIFFSRSWYKPAHCTFTPNGGRFPPHCVADSPGAAFHPRLNYPADLFTVTKGKKPANDGLSAFEGTGLHAQLRALGAKRVFVCGYTTDYSVRATVIEGTRRKYEMFILVDATEGLNVRRWDSRNAICDMVDAGAKKATTGDFR